MRQSMMPGRYKPLEKIPTEKAQTALGANLFFFEDFYRLMRQMIRQEAYPFYRFNHYCWNRFLKQQTFPDIDNLYRHLEGDALGRALVVYFRKYGRYFVAQHADLYRENLKSCQDNFLKFELFFALMESIQWQDLQDYLLLALEQKHHQTLPAPLHGFLVQFLCSLWLEVDVATMVKPDWKRLQALPMPEDMAQLVAMCADVYGYNTELRADIALKYFNDYNDFFNKWRQNDLIAYFRPFQHFVEMLTPANTEIPLLSPWLGQREMKKSRRKNAVLVSVEKNYWAKYGADYMASVGRAMPEVDLHIFALEFTLSDQQIKHFEATYNIHLIVHSLDKQELLSLYQLEDIGLSVGALSAMARYLYLPQILESYEGCFIADIDGTMFLPNHGALNETDSQAVPCWSYKVTQDDLWVYSPCSETKSMAKHLMWRLFHAGRAFVGQRHMAFAQKCADLMHQGLLHCKDPRHLWYLDQSALASAYASYCTENTNITMRYDQLLFDQE